MSIVVAIANRNNLSCHESTRLAALATALASLASLAVLSRLATTPSRAPRFIHVGGKEGGILSGLHLVIISAFLLVLPLLIIL